MSTEEHEGGRPRSFAGQAKRIGVQAWALVGIAIVVYIALRVIGVIWPAIELLLAGVVMGFIMSPLTNLLEDHGVPRAAGSLISLVVLVAVVALFFIFLAPPFVSQLAQMLGEVPAYVLRVREATGQFWENYGSSGTEEVRQVVDSLLDTVSSVGLEASSELAERLSNGLVSSAVSLVNGTVTIFLGLVVAFWLAKDYPVIVREFRVCAGPGHERSLTVLLAIMSRSMGGYLRGTVATSVFDGLLSFVLFAASGHPYAGLCAIIVGVFHFVPVIGSWVAVFFASALALFSSPMLALVTLLGSVVVQNVTDNIVSPLVMRSAVQIHPALSLLGLIIGSCLGGVLGMVLAVPLTAAIKSVFVYYFEQESGRQLVSYDGALFQGTPFRNASGDIEPAFDALDDGDFFSDTRLVDQPPAQAPVAGERTGVPHRTLRESVVELARAARRRAGAPKSENDEEKPN